MRSTLIHPPQQERSRRTLKRLIDAASDLLEDRDIEELSVAEIAERSGFSVGTFYRRFRDKEALLHVLDEELWKESSSLASEHREAKEHLAEVPLEEALQRLLAPFVRSYFERRGVRRALLLVSRSDPALRRRAADTERNGARALALFLASRDEFREWPEEALQTKAGVLVVQLVGFLREVVLFRELQAVAVPSEPEGVLDACVESTAGTIRVWAKSGPA